MHKFAQNLSFNIIKRHYNIAIFIPELACPHQCVFCNQEKISGVAKVPSPEDISKIIDQSLSTIDHRNSDVQIAFFGGSFTGIDPQLQDNYLAEAHKFIQAKKVSGIRISTRPDYIDLEILENLKKYGVTSIELGAQSLVEDVLKITGRGHNTQEVERAAKLIKSMGFELGLQMMLGLPRDTKQKSLETARKIISLGADTTRIYPTLVIEGTALSRMYKKGLYQALSLEQAVDWAKDVLVLFEQNNVKVLRTGLHPSEEFNSDAGLLAGPYHPSFKEMVLTQIWNDQLKNLENKDQDIVIFVSPKQLNYAIGYKKKNKLELGSRFQNVRFKTDPKLSNYEYYVGNS